MNTDFRGLWLLAGAWIAAYFTMPGLLLWVFIGLLALLLALLLRERHDGAQAAPWFTGPIVFLLGLLAVASLGLTRTECVLPEDQEHQRRAVLSFEQAGAPDPEGVRKGKATIERYWQDDAWVQCEIPVYLSVPYPACRIMPLPSRALSALTRRMPDPSTGGRGRPANRRCFPRPNRMPPII